MAAIGRWVSTYNESPSVQISIRLQLLMGIELFSYTLTSPVEMEIFGADHTILYPSLGRLQGLSLRLCDSSWLVILGTFVLDPTTVMMIQMDERHRFGMVQGKCSKHQPVLKYNCKIV